jgi:hypothetical protein
MTVTSRHLGLRFQPFSRVTVRQERKKMGVDEAGERPKKRPWTSKGAVLSAPAAGDADIGAASHIEGSAGAPVASSHPQPQPQPQPQSSEFLLDPAPCLEILNRLQHANLSLLIRLSGLKTPAAAKAKEVALGQAKPIAELVALCFDAIGRGARIRDGFAVFFEAGDLHRAQYGFLPVLGNLPGDVAELVLKQEWMIYDLKRTSLVASIDAANWVEAPGTPSSEASTPGISSSPGTPRTGAVGDGTTASSSSTMCSGVYE